MCYLKNNKIVLLSIYISFAMMMWWTPKVQAKTLDPLRSEEPTSIEFITTDSLAPPKVQTYDEWKEELDLDWLYKDQRLHSNNGGDLPKPFTCINSKALVCNSQSS